MKGQILRLGGDEHDIVQLLLPWYRNGALDEAESARVEAHLRGCARCQADIAWQRKLLDGIPAATDAVDAPADARLERARATLRANIEAATPPPARRSAKAPPSWRSTPAWLRWLLGLQFAAIAGVLLLAGLSAPRDEAYRALGAAPRAGAASIVVVFRPEASERQIRAALRDSDARLVDGPTVTGAYLLGVAPAQHTAALERPRQQAAVLRVESLEAGPER